MLAAVLGFINIRFLRLLQSIGLTVIAQAGSIKRVLAATSRTAS